MALSDASFVSAADLATYLDRIANLTPEQYAEARTEIAEETLAEQHARTYSLEEPLAPDALNADQKAVLLVAEELPVRTWKAIAIALAHNFGGVYRLAAGDVAQVEVPEELRPSRPAPVAEAPRRRPVRPPMWALIFLAVGISLLATVVARGLFEEPPEEPEVAESPVRVVASDVPDGATETHRVGQQRIVRTADGQVLVVSPVADGIQIVADEANQGRTWRQPDTVDLPVARSISVGVDERDDLQIAFAGPEGVGIATVARAGNGWEAGPILTLDAVSQDPAVDIAWDKRTDTGHIVWAHETAAGTQPYWASVTASDAGPVLLEAQALSPAGSNPDILANVAVDPDGSVVATFNRGDAAEGWFSRTATGTGSPIRYRWGRQQVVVEDAPVVAASFTFDRRGTGHLVLQDDLAFDLTYFSFADGAWSDGEIAADGAERSETDYPSVSVDGSSGLAYVFYQAAGPDLDGEIRLVVRDPATGWEGPYLIAPASDEMRHAALYPTSIGPSAGLPIVVWTRSGPPTVLQAARVAAP